jgi:alpha-L-rhamnosidase
MNLSVFSRFHCLMLLCVLVVLFAPFGPAPKAVEELPEATVDHLRCDYALNPLGIDTVKPRLSWWIISSARGVEQTAFQIRVALSEESLGSSDGILWDSGKVVSGESTHQPYGGPELRSGQRYYWQVKVWTGDAQETDWSQPAFWEMGLLTPLEWKASWIEPELEEDLEISQPCPMLRREFEVPQGIKLARLYVTSHGLYRLQMNGRDVSDWVFTPGWTSYRNWLQYQTYDVSDQLKTGKNAIGVILGDGWYRGYIGFNGQRNYYGKNLGLLLQLRVEYEDGHSELINSDQGWKASTGPIVSSDIYNGEHYDARKEKPGWSAPGFNDRKWSGVRVVDHPKNILSAQVGPPVRRIEEVEPVEILQTPAGETVFDMGQNMVGWVRLKVKGKAGRTITLRHAEVLDQDGNFYAENLRSAAQTVRYIPKGKGIEVYEPSFTFQGFRYVAVEGLNKPSLNDITGVVIHSDMTPTGNFRCSNADINQLQHNIVWGQKGNFLDVPTDCPQRDERLGWTGDAQVFASTAAFNMDVAAFFKKWLKDLAADQNENGAIPFVIPNVLEGTASAAWADAGLIIPWTLYVRYGDENFLEDQYPSMKAWVEYMRGRAGEDLLWKGDFHFGDWLSATYPDPSFPAAVTDKDLIATAFFAYSTSILEKAARVLGRREDAREYGGLLGRIKEAFQNEYITPNGRLSPSSQTAYVLALKFDLVPRRMRESTSRRLVEEIRKRDNHLSTGFVGASYLSHVLSDSGHLDVAYQLLLNDTYPSWLYPVKKGATTIWERWDGIRPDGSFQSSGMNSFNHYAYGAIGDWIYRVIGGIGVDPEVPGFKHFLVAPLPGGEITWAETQLDSMYGTIRTAWADKEERFELEVRVPPNTSATVLFPTNDASQILENDQSLSQRDGIRRVQEVGGVSVVVGSGDYRFSMRKNK